MAILFEGTATAMITPFNESGVDYDAFARQIDFQLNNDIKALVILGTTGEPVTMTDSEIEKTAKFAIKEINHRVPVIFGSGSNCTAKAVEKSRHMEELGADGLLVVTPYYNKCTQNGLVQYYHTIADNVGIPIICYNVPARTGVNIMPETMARIAEHKNVGGLKEACGNMEQICDTARLMRGKADLYSGDDNLNLPMMAIGSKGLISVASNILPKEVASVAKYYNRGEVVKAIEVQEKLLPIIDALFIEVNPIPVKAAMNMLKMGGGLPRAPLTELEDAHKLALKKALLGFGFKVE